MRRRRWCWSSSSWSLLFELTLLVLRLLLAEPEPKLHFVLRLREPRFERVLLLEVALVALPLVQLGVAPLDLHLALDGRDALDEAKHRRLIHLRARERLVGDDGHVELAALKSRPLAAALLGGVGLARLQALAQPT